MKIGICGQMCSGKTTLKNYIIANHENYYATSIAKKLKLIAFELFNMNTKNRKLLIDIGTKMREIDQDVWINYTINDCDQFENVIIDDIRYENELLKLKENNWITIKLIIAEELQLKRLKQTYPEDWIRHRQLITHESEKSNQLNNELFDVIFEINENNEKNIFKEIDEFISKKNM